MTQFHEAVAVVLMAFVCGMSFFMTVSYGKRAIGSSGVTRRVYIGYSGVSAALFLSMGFTFIVELYDLKYSHLQFPIWIRIPATDVMGIIAIASLCILLRYERADGSATEGNP